MARKNPRPEVSRRKFLAGVAVAGAATTVDAAGAANAATPPIGPRRFPSALRPTAQQIAAETELPKDGMPLGGRAGSDFMVDVIKSLEHRIHLFQSGLELPRPARVADQLRQEHDAGVHHVHARGIRRSRWRTAISRSPASRSSSLCHGTVGLQHATMAIYNAWCDRVPRHRDRRQRSRRLQASAGRADHPLGAGHQRAGARLHQVGRHAGVAPAFRAVVRARLQVRDDAAATGRS